MYNTLEENKEIIKEHPNSIISLTNGETQFDVIFAIVECRNKNKSLVQSGIGTQEKSLLVAINKLSSFVFALNGTAKHPDYVSEKLNIAKDDYEIAEQIAEIINSLGK